MEIMTFELESEFNDELNPGVVNAIHVSEWGKGTTVEPFTHTGKEKDMIENWDMFIPRPSYF